jgi:hypothetical protein
METRRGEGDARGPSPSPQGPQDASLRALGHTQRHDPSIPAASAPAQKAVASPLDSPQACSRKRPPALAEGVFATFLDQPAEKAGGASTRRRPPALASGAFATFLGEDAQPHGAESDAGWNVPSGGADGAGTSRQVPNCVSPHCEDAAETPTAAVAARPQLVEPLGIGALGPRGSLSGLHARGGSDPTMPLSTRSKVSDRHPPPPPHLRRRASLTARRRPDRRGRRATPTASSTSRGGAGARRCRVRGSTR